MTGMLASVNSLEEARIVLQTGVDIIDLKQPASGALGALDTDTVRKIVNLVQNSCPVSATVGDLPMQADTVIKAIKQMADTGVDYIKLGFFPYGDTESTLTKLAELDELNVNLIAVLFADSQSEWFLLEKLKDAGFHGVMLDTQNKGQGSLTDILTLTQIKQFIDIAKQQQLLTGLAGSLRFEDISKLQPMQADYLGFRGALCQQHQRTAELDLKAILRIKSAISQTETVINKNELDSLPMTG